MNNEEVNSNKEEKIDDFCRRWIEPKEKNRLEKFPQIVPCLDRLVNSLDDSTNKNRNFLITFILILLYMLITVSGVKDLDIFYPDRTITLPIAGFEVPITGFIFLAPLLLLIFHFNILYNFTQHCRKLLVWETLNGFTKDELFLPGFILNAVTKFDKKKSIHILLLKFAVFFALFILPIGILLGIQIQFSRFHNTFYTAWHTIITLMDILLLAIYWHNITEVSVFQDNDDTDSLDTIWRRHCREEGGLKFAWKYSIVFISFLPLLVLLYIEDFIGGFFPGIKGVTAFISVVFLISNLISLFFNWGNIGDNSYLKNLKSYLYEVYSFSGLRRNWRHTFIVPAIVTVSVLLFCCTPFWGDTVRYTVQLLALLPTPQFYTLAALPDGYYVVYLLYLTLFLPSPLISASFMTGEGRELTLLKAQKQYLQNFLTNLLQSFIECALIAVFIMILQQLNQHYPNLIQNPFFTVLTAVLLFLVYCSYNFSFFPALSSGGNGAVQFFKRILSFCFFTSLKPVTDKIAELYRSWKIVTTVNKFSTIIAVMTLINVTSIFIVNRTVFMNKMLEISPMNREFYTVFSKKLNRLEICDEIIAKVSPDAKFLTLGDISSPDKIPVDIYSVVDLSNRNFTYIDLSGSQLSRVNFSGKKSRMLFADFTGANLEEADFNNADLRYSDFRNCKLRGVNFNSTNLEGAELGKANLYGADLKGANLLGANLERTVFERTDLRTTLFRRSGDYHYRMINLKYANLSHTNMAAVDLRGADLREAFIYNADFRETDLRSADLTKANLFNSGLMDTDCRKANFSNAILSRADLSRADLREAKFTEANLKEADFKEADLRGTDFRKADLRDTDFSNTRVDDANFYQAKISLNMLKFFGTESAADIDSAILFTAEEDSLYFIDYHE